MQSNTDFLFIVGVHYVLLLEIVLRNIKALSKRSFLFIFRRTRFKKIASGFGCLPGPETDDGRSLKVGYMGQIDSSRDYFLSPVSDLSVRGMGTVFQ